MTTRKLALLFGSFLVIMLVGDAVVQFSLVRLVFGVPMVLLWPGYSFTRLLAAKTSLEPIETLVLSVALSLVWTAVITLAFHILGISIQWFSLTVALVLVSMIGLFVSQSRYLAFLTQPAKTGLLPRQRDIALLGLALVSALVALEIAQLGADQKSGTGFTQLWIQPLETDPNRTVQIGIASFEPDTRRYRLVLKQQEEIIETWDTIELAPEEQFQVNYSFPNLNPVNSGDTIQAELYLEASLTSIYRRVTWQIVDE